MTSHHKKSKTMGNVKIKRIKRNKKEVTTKEKVLAGLGLASSLASTGAGLASPNKTAIVSEVSNASNANNNKVKQQIENIFGIPTAHADFVLTAQNASTTTYDPSLNDQLSGIHDDLVSLIQSGSIQTINGDSVTAFMLGWGGASSGANQTVLGQTYNFNGAAWQIQSQTPIIAAPSITGAQGYDPSTGSYTNNIVTAGKYLILYGNFTASGNTVQINGQNVTPDVQTVNQINVPLANINLSGLSYITVTVSNTGGTSQSVTVQVSAPAPVIKQITVSGSLNDGTVNQSYYGSLTASNGNGNYNWTAQGLPSGLNVNSSTGTISGTPTESGNFSVTVTANDGTNTAGAQQFTIYINPPAAVAPTITGIQGYDATTGSYTNGTAVAGKYLILYGNFSANQDNSVSIDGQQANITAQTQNQINVLLGSSLSSGQHNATVINTGGTSNPSSFNVQAPPTPASQITISGTPASGTLGQSYSSSLSAANGNGNYTWSVQGNLPAGLTFSNGQITGTPTTTGDFSFAVSASDGINTAASQNYTLHIASTPAPTAVAPTISGVQGYDAVTNQYTDSVHVTAGKYLILYGNFSANQDNQATIDGQTSNITYQSSSQINVLLDASLASGSHSVIVSNPGGTSSQNSFTVLTPTPPAPTGISQTDATAFVSNLYATVLNRQPDASGLSYFVGELTSGNKTEDQVQAEFMADATSELAQDAQNVIPQANTTSYGSLNSYQQQALTTYLTNNPNALTSQNFSTFAPGSIFAWALGMGTSTTLNTAAQSLGFTTYDGGQNLFTKQQTPPAGQTAPTISGIQGYDATTNQYTNSIAAAGKYLILYGSFSDNNDNQVQLDGQTANITGQTANQINVLLDSNLTAGQHTVTVSNSDGMSGQNTFTTVTQTQTPTASQIAVTGTVSSGSVNQPYSTSFTASDGNGDYDWTISGNLPAGLNFANGAITGTPTQAGDFSFTITASDGTNTPGTQQFSLHIDSALTAVTDARIQQMVTGSNTILYGSLTGDEQSALTNYLTDNPTALTSQNFSTFAPGSIFAWALGMGTSTSLNLTAKSLGFVSYDSDQGLFVKQQVQNPAAQTAPTISGIQGYDATTGSYTNGTAVAGKYLILYGNFSANQDNQVQVDGQIANITAQTQNQINVLLSSNLSSGQHNITVSNGGGTSSASTFTVTAPVQTPIVNQITVSGSLAAGAVSQAYSAGLTATNGNGNYTWSISGSLPSGLTFNNGQITGTPTQSGNFSFTITASDGVNTAASQNYTLHIAPVQANVAAPTISGIQGYNATTGQYTNSNNVTAGQYLILYGNFSANNDNQVSIDGQAANETAQTQNQINVLLSGNLASGQHTVMVTNPDGTSSQSFFTIQTPAPSTPTVSAPILTAAQAFDPATNAYTSGNATSNKYLILYGNFAASGNTVSINGQTVPAGNITYQSANQINVQLGDLTGQTSLSVSVSNSGGDSQSLNVKVVAPTPSTSTKTAAITGVQGFDPTTDAYSNNVALTNTYLILYGVFDPLGDTVTIDGQPATVTGHTANQINVSLKGITVGNHSVVVTTTFGTTIPAAFSVTSPSSSTQTPTTAAPVLNSAQGFNSATNTYETDAGSITANDDYLILYGTFAASGNTVLINGQAIPANAITYQSAGQINVSLANMTVAGETMVISVSNPAGTSQTMNVKVAGSNIVKVTGTDGTKGLQAMAMVSQINVSSSFLKGLTAIGSPITLTDQSPYQNTINGGVVNQYSVQYYRMADGETEAVFTYDGNYPNSNTNAGNRNYHGWTFVVRNGSISHILSDGSLQFLDTPNWAPGQAPTMSPLYYIVQNIMQNMPAKNALAPGLNFSTPLSANLSANTFMLSGLYPVVLNFDSNGGLISVHSANATGYGSGIYWFRVGNGYIDTTTDGRTNQLIYYLQFPGLGSGSAITLQNVNITNDGSGNPTQLTAQVNGTNLTLNVVAPQTSASTPVNSATLQMVNINPDPSGTPQYLIVNNGQMVGLAGGAATNAYQYIIKNNLSNATVSVTGNGNYQVTIGSGSTQQVVTFNAITQQGNTSYQNQIDEQNGIIVLQESDGSLSVAYGSPDPVNAETLDDVTLTKDSSGDITSAIGTDTNGVKVALVSVGNFWAAVPLNPDGTFPVSDTDKGIPAYPSITLYGEDPNTGQMSAVLTLNNVYFSGTTNNINDLTRIVGQTPAGASLDMNVGAGWSSNTQGLDLSSLTFTLKDTLANGQQEWAVDLDGKPYTIVDSQGKATLEYAQQNDLQVIDFGSYGTVTGNDALSQYYYLMTNTGLQKIDGNSGQLITDPSVLSQISQAIGVSTPNLGDLSWVTDVLNNSPAIYLSSSVAGSQNPSAQMFVMSSTSYQSIFNSYLAAMGEPANETSGGQTFSYSQLQNWVSSINQAIQQNNGQVPENMQAFMNFMTQAIPVYDSTGKQVGTTQLAQFNTDNTSAPLSLNPSAIQSVQNANGSNLTGNLVLITIPQENLDNPTTISNTITNTWLALAESHEIQHANDSNDLQSNYGGDINAWLNGQYAPDGTQTVAPSATAQYVHSLPGVVQAFLDAFQAATNNAQNYSLGNPYDTVTESAAYANQFSTIIATLQSNNSNFPDDASKLQWALNTASPAFNATVKANPDGSLAVSYNGGSMTINNLNNPDQLAISVDSGGLQSFYTNVGQAGSTAFSFNSLGGLYDITSNGQSIAEVQDKTLTVQLDVPNVGIVTINPTDGSWKLADGTGVDRQNSQVVDAVKQAETDFFVNGKNIGTIQFTNSDGSQAFDVSRNGNAWSYALPDGTLLLNLPSVSGNGNSYYTVEKTSDGSEYTQFDNQGKPTGGNITKKSDGTIVIDDGQGNSITRNADGTSVAEITMEDEDGNSQTVTVRRDAQGNVTSWTDDSGTHTGNTAAFNSAIDGLTPVDSTLPDLSDPNKASQYLNSVSQQVDSSQQNTNPGDNGGDTGDDGGD